MKFDLEHDWQGNMATPQAKVGERAKTHLLLILSTIWLMAGLIGHQPWKPFESAGMSIIKHILDGGNWLTPMAASQHQMAYPPLYYWSAALFAKLLGGLLNLHDAARIASGVWMAITLQLIGMTGREIWGKGIGRQTTFVLIGALGLALNAHILSPHVAGLTGITMAFYALSLCKRRPLRAGLILGTGTGIAFLSLGLLPLLVITVSCLLLPILFSAWRNKRFGITLAIAALGLLPWLLWLVICWRYAPNTLHDGWAQFWQSNQQAEHVFFMRTLIWYAWPALPLALWGAWRFRQQLFKKPKFQLIWVFFGVTLASLGWFAPDKEVFALPMLIPLTAMAGGSIETLKRGAAGAVNWFGLVVFGLMSLLIWLGWLAMMTGEPAKLKERILFLTSLKTLEFNPIGFLLAAFVTLIWLLAVLRTRHTNRAAATNWAIGMTCVWTLLMTLWLPLLDAARSYNGVFTSLKQALPAQHSCLSSHHLGDAQMDFLHYYTGIKALRHYQEASQNCDLYLVQDEKGREQFQPGDEWKLIWTGKRPSERRESFRLFTHR